MWVPSPLPTGPSAPLGTQQDSLDVIEFAHAGFSRQPPRYPTGRGSKALPLCLPYSRATGIPQRLHGAQKEKRELPFASPSNGLALRRGLLLAVACSAG